MPTVAELAAPYANVLVPVLPAGPGVCQVCWTVSGDYQRCWACKEAFEFFGHGRANVIVPIALAVKGEQLAYELWHYKNSRNKEARRKFTVGLAAVTWMFLASHERCIARSAGASRFDAVTIVPSAKAREGPYTLRNMIGAMIGVTADRFEDLLVPDPAAADDPHTIRADRFTAQRRIDGTSVLLVDDTWTRGAQMQAAAATLKQAGAANVGGLVIGRHFDRQFGDGESYYRQAKERRFDWTTCCMHS